MLAVSRCGKGIFRGGIQNVKSNVLVKSTQNAQTITVFHFMRLHKTVT